jgi:hypothetical protein
VTPPGGIGVATGKGRVKVVRFRIIGLDSETRSRWKSLGQSVKRVTNCFWRSWLSAHNQLGNPARVREYLAELRAWHKAGGKGSPPVCEVQCLTNEMTSAIRAEVRSTYPELNNRCIDLTLQILGRRAFHMKSSRGAVPRWMRILADDGEYPSSSGVLPIPFDKGNSEIIVPATDNDSFQLQVRVDRIERPERSYATSTKDVCRLRSNRQTRILWQIVNGEFVFAGSNLVYYESSGKWLAHIYYQARKGEAKSEVEAHRTAFLRPAVKRPWWLRIDGYHHYVGGRDGKHVAYVRQQLLTDRWGRQESYQHASSARKGHGRDRAVGKIVKLKDRWKDFVKTANQLAAKQAVDLCVLHKCGRLVYLLPIGPVRESRFLHTAGKLPDHRDNSSWDWSQMQSILAYKCQQAGIDLEVRKAGETRVLSSLVDGTLADDELADGKVFKGDSRRKALGT